MGVMFGGVVDEDTTEETLESVFLSDSYGYVLGAGGDKAGKDSGRWVSFALKKPKPKGGGTKKKAKKGRDGHSSDEEVWQAYIHQD